MSDDTSNNVESKRLIQKDEERKMNDIAKASPEYGERLRQMYKTGKLDRKVFEDIHYLFYNKPDQMRGDEHKNFLKALVEGRFSDKGKKAQVFLKALSGGKNEAGYAKKLMTKLADGRDLNQTTEKAELQKLKELRELDRQEKAAEDTLKDTGIDVGTRLERALTKNAIEDVTNMKSQNVAMEMPPAHIKERLNNMKTLESKVSSLEKKIAELNRNNSENQNDKEIEDLYLQIDKLDEQMDNEYTAHIEGWKTYMERMLAQMRNIKYLAGRTGLDIKTVNRLAMWFLSSTGDGGESPKLRGIKINDETGRAEKAYQEVYIKRIFHDRDEKALKNPEATGILKVEYTDQNGKKDIVSMSTFIGMIDAYEAHEPIDNKDELDERIIGSTYAKPLEVGDQFFADIPSNLSDEAGVQYNKETFEVEEIGDDKIVLNKAVLIVPKETLQRSVSNTLYFDRYKKVFTFGEFAKLVNQKGYTRKLNEGEDLDQIAEKMAKKQIEEALSYAKTDEARERIKNGGIVPTEKELVPTIKKKISGERLAQLMNKGDIQADDTDISAPVEGEVDESEEQKNEAAKAAQGPKKAKFYEESLPKDVVDKSGGMNIDEKGFFATMWDETYVLSVGDMWEMGKTMYEYYIRRFERKQKSKYSAVGKNLPFFAPEMQRINQAAENEQVNSFKESLEQSGIAAMLDVARTTRNQDEMKATLISLNEKGQMRWDDIGIWNNLNRFVKDPTKRVPIPVNGDPYTKMSKDDERTGMDFLSGAVDSIWGANQYGEWYSQNKSKFASEAKGFEEKGKELENFEGGHERHLAHLLRMHKQGEFVNPQEYEGLIIHAISNGKSSLTAKLYYMVEGVAAENERGETILSYDRMAHINGETLAKFPMMEYLTESSVVRPDGGKYTWTKDDYKKWAMIFDNDQTSNPDMCKPSKAVNDFMWKYIIPSESNLNRINKDLRNGENLDHDDMYAYLPPATSEVLTDTCGASAGNKKYLTIEGYANAYPGFSEYMRTLALYNNRDKLTEAVKSYVRFNSIMASRWQKEKGNTLQRLGEKTMNSPPIVSDTPPKAYADQMNIVVFEIADAYSGDFPELPGIVRTMYTDTGRLDVPENKKAQADVQNALEEFDKIFGKVVKSDNGAKMTAIIGNANLQGMPKFVSDEERDKRKASYQNDLELNY